MIYHFKNSNMSKKVFIRIRKVAKNRYMIEERHTFMFFWRFYIKGSIKLRIPKFYASVKLAEYAINTKAAAKGYKPFGVSRGK